MAYFRQKNDRTEQHERLFRHPVTDDDWEEEVPQTEEDRLRNRHAVATGVADFFGVIAGTVAILVVIAVLISLLNWLREDFGQFLELWRAGL